MAGRGRGRGRGRGPMMPRITDDEGNVVPASEIGPPPLFPVRSPAEACHIPSV